MLKSNDSVSLSNELADARQKYVNKRNSVLERASQRRGVISETVADLRREDESLAKVEEQAREG